MASILFGAQAFASDLDQELSSYIETFKLRPLEELEGKREKLYRAGRALFSDTVLSGNRNISCKDCHHPEKGTSDGIALSLGEGAENGALRMQGDGLVLKRHSPVLFNLGHPEFTTMFWDGRVGLHEDAFRTPEPALNGSRPAAHEIVAPLRRALDAQTIFPIVSHEEMRGMRGSNKIANASGNLEAWELIVKRIERERPEVASLLREEFGTNDLNIGHVGAALGEFVAFEFQVTKTPYDEYLRGDKEALSEEEKRGMKIFFTKGRCGNCHLGPHLTNHITQNVGVPPVLREGDSPDSGQGFVYDFKTPGLRNVVFSAPYMHNGVFKTLDEVIEHYNNLKESIFSHQLGQDQLLPYREQLYAASKQEISSIYKGVFQPFLRRGLGLSEEEKELLKLFLVQALSQKK